MNETVDSVLREVFGEVLSALEAELPAAKGTLVQVTVGKRRVSLYQVKAWLQDGGGFTSLEGSVRADHVKQDIVQMLREGI